MRAFQQHGQGVRFGDTPPIYLRNLLPGGAVTKSTMKIGKSFSFILLLAVALSSVGFTTLAWYCPMESKTEKVICGSCANDASHKQDCQDDHSCKQSGERMKIQPDLSAAVKIQPNLDSPESKGLVELPEEITSQSKTRNYTPVFERALPDRVAHEHVVLRI